MCDCNIQETLTVMCYGDLDPSLRTADSLTET